ncbi:MAG: nucleotide sugar dehydrogenase [Planctomycetota bacterium]|jgi:UDP-N-acetyl-D-glucosamine dehydrogenase|nr:nucleotide sugar dehydrogenase [Planctomycetota bacterium]
MKKRLLGEFQRKASSRQALIGVVGIGYAGLPLCANFSRAGFRVIGFDPDAGKRAAFNAGRAYIKNVPPEDMRLIRERGGRAVGKAAELAEADAILVCVPTPLTRQREPDLGHVAAAAETLAGIIRPGQLISLESTTYPGTSREEFLPRLEKGGLRGGIDFGLAYSPEREDPGGHSARDIPKVMGGLTRDCLRMAQSLYAAVSPAVVPVSSLETAEASKLLENIFRCVNIAMVNEMKRIFTRMGIDIWEAIEAAKSKPFGFMPFYPGPGLGGHCIPIDPFYLTWKAREFKCPTRFIELAGEINSEMPEYVAARTAEGLNRFRKSIGGSRVLLLGLAYKKDVDDIRESPSLRLIELFSRQGARVDYHDPYVPTAPRIGKRRFSPVSIPLTAGRLKKYDAVVIATDHSGVDYGLVGRNSRLIIDARNAMAGVRAGKGLVIKA